MDNLNMKNKTTKEPSVNIPKKEKKEFHSDVLGSYTGVPEDGGIPIQDADDL